jgi:hypothetical protein
MKQYFIDKLTSSMRSINTIKKNIISAATNMELGPLIKLPTILQEEQEKYSELIVDLCTYCSVDDVIEISNLKDRYSQEPLSLINVREIERFYKYSTKGITLRERTLLVERFGWPLKEAKVV